MAYFVSFAGSDSLAAIDPNSHSCGGNSSALPPPGNNVKLGGMVARVGL